MTMYPCCARSKHVRRDRVHVLQMFFGRLFAMFEFTAIILSLSLRLNAVRSLDVRGESMRTRDRRRRIAYYYDAREKLLCTHAASKPESANDKTDRAPADGHEDRCIHRLAPHYLCNVNSVTRTHGYASIKKFVHGTASKHRTLLVADILSAISLSAV